MTADERAALVAERTELQRKYTKSQGTAGYGARARKLAEMIEAIDAQLDAPEQPIVDEPVPEMVSLAGQTLGDPDATDLERSLAGKILSDARD